MIAIEILIEMAPEQVLGYRPKLVLKDSEKAEVEQGEFDEELSKGEGRLPL